MKHDWKNVSHLRKGLGHRETRQCAICGRTQEQVNDGMGICRYFGYRWVPRVGRCPGTWSPNRHARQMKLDRTET